MKIECIRKNVYGNELIYVVGDSNKYLERLTGKKTISERDISALESLGLEVVFLPSY